MYYWGTEFKRPLFARAGCYYAQTEFPKNSRLLNSRSHSRSESLAPSLPPSFIAFLPSLFHFFLSGRLCLPLSFFPRLLLQLCCHAAALQPYSWTCACIPHSRRWDWRGSTLGKIGDEVFAKGKYSFCVRETGEPWWGGMRGQVVEL